MKRPGWWNAHSLTSRLLAPLGVLYGLGGTLHRWCTRARRVGAPVISVGNIVAGGAGKTPSVMMLAELLKASNLHPHILSRGYGATLAGPVRVNTQKHHATEVGDEALLLARAAPAWVFPKRVQSAARAVAAGADVLLCDDALQHHALAKDINLLVLDGVYGLGNGRLLPAGPLRETLKSALKRVHGIIFIGEDKHLLKARLPVDMPIFHADVVPVGDVSFLYPQPLVAFAGIARPEKFFASLKALGAPVIAEHSFADHHPFREEELEALRAEAAQRGARLITTEKDWVRLPTSFRAHCHTLPVRLRFHQPEAVLQFLLAKLGHA